MNLFFRQEDNIHWIIFIPFLCIAILEICIMEVALWLKRRRIAAETNHTKSYGGERGGAGGAGTISC